MRLHSVLTVSFFLFSVGVAESQTILPNSWRDLEQRAYQLNLPPEALMWRTRSTLRNKPGLELNPVHIYGSWNSNIPSGWSDGALWQGKGFNTMFSSGVTLGGEFWSLFLVPELIVSENSEFPLNPFTTRPPFGDSHGDVWDHPTRFGSDALYSIASGQSGVEAFWGPARITLSTENLIWGSSRYNAMLLSSQGPGVPKLELSIDPWDSELGKLETHLLFGLLASSKNAPVTTNGDRFLGALFLGYSPPLFQNLTLGAARSVLASWDQIKWQDFFMPLNPGINLGFDEYDQRISLYYRWKEPAVGFEMYGEWGRSDFSPSWTSWLLNIERTQNWVLGFRKSQPLDGKGILYIEGEIAVLSLGLEGFINENIYNAQGGDFYTHSLIRNGYTIQGQDLGAAVGNGNMQMFSIFYLAEKEFIGYELRRWVKDYSVLLTDPYPGKEHQINVAYEHELRGGFRNNDWEISVSLSVINDMNRYFERKDVYSFSGHTFLRFEF